MIWTIIEYLATIVQCLVSTEFVTRYLGWKKKDKKHYIAFLAAFLTQVGATLIMNRITLFEGVAGIIYPGIVVIYGIFFLNGSIYEKIVIASIDNVLKMIISVSILTLISYLSPYEVNYLIVQRGFERFFVLVFTQSSYFFFTRMFLRLQKNNKLSLSISEWFAILCVFITSFGTGVLVFEILLTSANTSMNNLYAVLIMASLILINILCYYIFVNMSAKNKEKLRYSLMELKLEEQEKNLFSIKQSYEDMRKIRHDMKNYVECAVTLLHNGKNMEASKYLEKLIEDKMSFVNQMVFTKCDAVNAVISSKISLCEKYNITFKYEITGSVDKVSELDISILLANLLDNAIEASIELKKEKEIILHIYNERNYLVILIGNLIGESVLSKNPQLITTKKDKLHHGVGTISIKDIVNKHNGMLSVYEKEQHFYVDIWISLEQDN